MNTFNNKNVIEQYLLGALKVKDSKAFERRMESDLSLRQEVMAYQDPLK